MKRVDERADERTLRLASPAISAAQLAQYLVYQRALKASLGDSVDSASDAAFAAAHEKAKGESGLSGHELELIRKVVRRFAGNRAAARRLLAKHGQLQTTNPERADKLLEELARLEGDLRRRDDEKTLDVLTGQLAEILSLHAALGRFG